MLKEKTKGTGLKRREQKSFQKRALERARSALQRDRGASLKWKPGPVTHIQPTIGMSFDARLKCERLIRAQNRGSGSPEMSQHSTVISEGCDVM